MTKEMISTIACEGHANVRFHLILQIDNIINYQFDITNKSISYKKHQFHIKTSI